MKLMNYRTFENILLLPPHNNEKNIENNLNITTLKKLYDLNNKNIIDVGNHINNMYNEGYYIKVKHVVSGIELIYHNEPSNIFGVPANNQDRIISINKHKNIRIKNDSIVINIKGDNSLLILSIKDDYEITFIKPKIIISESDPHGEEDWNS